MSDEICEDALDVETDGVDEELFENIEE